MLERQPGVTHPQPAPCPLCCPAGALQGQNPRGSQREPVGGVDRGPPAGHRAGGEGKMDLEGEENIVGTLCN